MDRPSPLRAELGMYPFASVRWAWDALWTAVSDRVAWAPTALDHSGDVHAAWSDPDVIVNHVCGWPFAALHRDTMHLVGAFDLELPDEPSVGTARYRSVLVTTDPQATIEDLIGQRAAINSVDSLSGSLSLLSATVGTGKRWPGILIETSSHINSISALIAGDADIACIDAWTLALLNDTEPALTAELRRLGFGPVIPTPAITVRDQTRVAELAAAFAASLADPATVDARRALHIRGWHEPDIATYEATLAL